MIKKIFKTNQLTSAIFLIYVATGLALYNSVIKAFFVSDDFDWLWRAKEFPVASYFLKNVNGSLENGVYRPLVSLSFWIENKLFGLNSIPFHLTNIILFSLTAGLIFILLKQLSVKKSWAFLAGLFFVILPNHPEAVSWISGRGDVLSTFFYLASLILFIHFRNSKKIWAIIFSLISFALALLSKEMAMTLPGIIVLYEILWQWPNKEKTDKIIIGETAATEKNNYFGIIKNWFLARFLQLSPFALILAGYFWARWQTTKTFVGFYASPELHFNLVHSFKTLAATFLSNFTNNRLAIIDSILHHNQLLLCLFIIFFCLLFFIIKNFSKNKVFIFGIFFFLIGSLPIISLSYSSTTAEGERFAYLPSVGVAICLSVLIMYFKNLAKRHYQKIIFWAVPVFLIIFLSNSLFVKNLAWREAGDLSQSLLLDLGNKVDLSQKQGVVILGLPDNLSGAQVLRNGWLKGVGLIYPNYNQDMLAVKIGFNLSPKGSTILPLTWEKTAIGFKVSGPPNFFIGTGLESLDYKMSNTVKNSVVEFFFTSEFFDNLNVKPLVFLKEDGKTFSILERMEKR